MSLRTPNRPTRLVAAVVVVALALGAGTALAAKGDPRKDLTAADNARARSMLVRKADLGPGFTSSPGSPQTVGYCRALDESDLTLTGEAESPNFARAIVFVSSAAQVYESAADASASWRRATSPAGDRCQQQLLRRGFRAQGVEFTSMRRTPFPKVAPRTVAYRVQLSTTAQGTTVKVFVDYVVLMHSRAQVALFFGSGLAPVPKADQTAIARLTAGRMAVAMRG